MKRDEALARRPLDEYVSATLLIRTCVKDLRERLETANKDVSYKEARGDILAWPVAGASRGPG